MYVVLQPAPKPSQTLSKCLGAKHRAMSTDMYEVVLLHVRRWQRQQRSSVGVTAHDCITLLEQERLGSKLDHRCDLDWQYDAGA